MNARRKLNQFNINGALQLALVIGCMFQSLSVFIVVALYYVHARYSSQRSPRLSVPQFSITTTAEPPLKIAVMRIGHDAVPLKLSSQEWVTCIGDSSGTQWPIR